MRKVTYGGAISLDGFLAGPDERLDWLRWTEDSAKLASEVFRGVDTILMGRKTFEAGQRMGGGPKMKGVVTYIFSRTLQHLPQGADGELVRDEAAEFVRTIRGELGGDILVMGGGEIGTALLEAGLVDEIGFSVHPVLLGGGTPAFRPMAAEIELALSETRPIAGDCVLVRYRVLHR
jgi:dihydrofolate reductase